MPEGVLANCQYWYTMFSLEYIIHHFHVPYPQGFQIELMKTEDFSRHKAYFKSLVIWTMLRIMANNILLMRICINLGHPKSKPCKMLIYSMEYFSIQQILCKYKIKPTCFAFDNQVLCSMNCNEREKLCSNNQQYTVNHLNMA